MFYRLLKGRVVSIVVGSLEGALSGQQAFANVLTA